MENGKCLCVSLASPDGNFDPMYHLVENFEIVWYRNKIQERLTSGPERYRNTPNLVGKGIPKLSAS